MNPLGPALSTVLVVEADPPLRERLGRALRRRSVAGKVAQACERALEAACRHGCSITIVVVPLPGRPAFALIRRFEPGRRILMMRGYDSIAATVDALRTSTAGTSDSIYVDGRSGAAAVAEGLPGPAARQPIVNPPAACVERMPPPRPRHRLAGRIHTRKLKRHPRCG